MEEVDADAVKDVQLCRGRDLPRGPNRGKKAIPYEM